MYIEMEYYWLPLSTQSFLLRCDIDLVKEALTTLLHLNAENSASPESIKLVHNLNNYLKECANAFLASERIRLFLLLSLFVSVIVSFIALAMLPVNTLSITLICIISLVLFSVNVFTLLNQTHGHQQEIDWNTLKKHCSNYTEKLYSENFKPTLTNTTEKISSPTSALCLFPARKSPKNNEFKHNTPQNSFNNFENNLPRNNFRHLLFNTL
ncbi:hypothetical protein [Rickettsiella endosymbiont of Litargus connexus]|jgi:hypothetical protein|uniref:hypothetical protein n=1 Tax=Rickettsiella endosymbiont of Litargus connexus TaxID=3066237 RepID=UPI0027EAD692|nr:hypothetical protein [Gammaproteobacteria bacterium]MDD4893296.1 hypothetical protein [Candidatus Rickettsiella isopodorum]MDD5161971.1 hypothetical protein [Candidatus Rickettsiella isopodorum]MDQ5900418.1 hypothetical protein [Pseudomonadota bacterium]